MSRKKKEKEEPPAEETVPVHILYDETVTGGERDDPEPYSSRSDKIITTTFKGAVVGELTSFRWLSESFNVPKSAFNVPRTHVFAVVAYYRDGDTFGKGYGYTHFEGVYGNADYAHMIAKAVETASDGYPWHSYFAGLDRVEVELLPIISMGPNTVADPSNLSPW